MAGTIRNFVVRYFFVMDCFDLLHAPDDDVSDDSSNKP